ncbi:MAG: ACT domain-containing protein [Acidobacteriota bacterium]
MPETRPRRVRIKVWVEPYAVARLASIPNVALLDPGGPPVALVVGYGEISLLAPEAVVDALPETAAEVSRGWRALTLDTVFPLETTGVLAAVSRSLAEVGIPVMTFSSFATDHFLVAGSQVERALAALNQVRLERFLPTR